MKKTSPFGPDTALYCPPPPPPPPPPHTHTHKLTNRAYPGIIFPRPGKSGRKTAVDTPRKPLDGRGMKNYAVRMTTGNPARRRADPIRARGLTWAWGGVDFRPIRRWRRRGGVPGALRIAGGAAVGHRRQRTGRGSGQELR